MNTKEILEASPRPHYLNPNNVVITDENKKLTGIVHFPSTVASIGDRVDHVNAGDSYFALWNCVYVLAFHFFKNEKKKLWAKEIHVEALHPLLPDTDIEIACAAIFNPNSTKKGKFDAEFSLKGKVLQKVSVEFVIH